MARSRKKKKSVSQTIVGVATTGMPKPVRGFLGNRLVASGIVLALPVLALTGIVSVDWQGGRPKLSIDEERAAEVKQNLHEVKEQVAERIEAFRAGETVDGPPLGNFVPALRRDQDSALSERPDWLNFEDAADRIAERVTEVSDRLRQEAEEPAPPEEKTAQRPVRPLFQFK